MIDICEDESNDKESIKKLNLSPFHEQSYTISTTPDLNRKISSNTNRRGPGKGKVGETLFLLSEYTNIKYWFSYSYQKILLSPT